MSYCLKEAKQETVLFRYSHYYPSTVVNGTHESARGTPVCPLGVLQSLRAAGWVIPADQQDAHELLHVLLSCVEEETIAMARKVRTFKFLIQGIYSVFT